MQTPLWNPWSIFDELERLTCRGRPTATSS